MQPLHGKVAVVAGATRGAGRGIACTLGEAGATVYCTGRSVRGKLSTISRPETIDETAEMVTARGGVGLWAQVDHTQPDQVQALFKQVAEERHGRLDILVNNISGDWNLKVNGIFPNSANPASQWKHFWAASLAHGLQAQQDGVQAHLIASHYAVPLMVANGHGLIIEVTDANHFGYNDCGVFYSLTKASAVLLAYYMAEELRGYNVAAVALTPGDMLSEVRLEQEVGPNANWDEIRKTPGLAKAESCFYVGRAAAALAADPNIMARSGHALSTGQLAREYGFTDIDGTRPIWYPGEGVFQKNGNFVVQEDGALSKQ
jgi:NAD(P)-dependent dehydrogenase (short-subunit alcohol dehydrogenase family)